MINRCLTLELILVDPFLLITIQWLQILKKTIVVFQKTKF